MEQQVGVDIGRALTKAATTGSKRAMFPSVVGSKSTTSFGGIGDAAFSLNGSTAIVVEHPEFGCVEREVGENALSHSATAWAPRHREQLQQDLVVLLSNGLQELKAFGDLDLCVGTPAQFYDAQKASLEKLFKASWTVNGHQVDVGRVVVLPQPIGTAWHLAVDQQGKVRPKAEAFFGKKVGILDIGEYSTDGVVLDNMKNQGNRMVTVEYGCGKVKEAVASFLTDQGYPRLPYQVDDAIKNRELAGINLEPVIEDAVADGVRAILSEVAARWDDRPEYSRIVIPGGGAYLFGQRIKQAWDKVEIAPLPEWSNVLGYLAFLMFLGRR